LAGLPTGVIGVQILPPQFTNPWFPRNFVFHHPSAGFVFSTISEELGDKLVTGTELQE
jgi:hypothetical protein